MSFQVLNVRIAVSMVYFALYTWTVKLGFHYCRWGPVSECNVNRGEENNKFHSLIQMHVSRYE